jgi:hypothetical protein
MHVRWPAVLYSGNKKQTHMLQDIQCTEPYTAHTAWTQVKCQPVMSLTLMTVE